uniref:Cilia- and flagella-associated protein 157 n=1 Tax=Pinguiococcus pyrenoidosus TaxID=172671 RepID=A0A7R9YBW8_9STRA|mmetsp:Transcript_16887/g.64317  ORF Transcript_16887/g.64317 Transcript_16887/m.64317 type:complete len:500 (+) Transcript_16887:2283-3782(+)
MVAEESTGNEAFGKRSDGAAGQAPSAASMEREQLLKKIAELRQQLRRQERAATSVEARLKARKAEIVDVNYALSKRLDDNYDIIAELERRLLRLETEWEENRTRYEEERKDRDNALEKRATAEGFRLQGLRDDLEKLAPLIAEKEALLRRQEELVAEQEGMKGGTWKRVVERERGLIRDRNKLLQQNFDQVRLAVERIRQSSDLTREKTIRHTITTNEKLREQMLSQRLESEASHHRYKVAVGENSRLERELKIAEAFVEQVSAQVAAAEKRLKTLRKLHQRVDNDADTVGVDSIVSSVSEENSVVTYGIPGTTYPELSALKREVDAALEAERTLEKAIGQAEKAGDPLAFAALDVFFQLEQEYAFGPSSRKGKKVAARAYGEVPPIPLFTSCPVDMIVKVLRRAFKALSKRGFASCDVHDRAQKALILPSISSSKDAASEATELASLSTQHHPETASASTRNIQDTFSTKEKSTQTEPELGCSNEAAKARRRRVRGGL